MESPAKLPMAMAPLKRLAPLRTLRLLAVAFVMGGPASPLPIVKPVPAFVTTAPGPSTVSELLLEPAVPMRMLTPPTSNKPPAATINVLLELEPVWPLPTDCPFWPPVKYILPPLLMMTELPALGAPVRLYPITSAILVATAPFSTRRTLPVA